MRNLAAQSLRWLRESFIELFCAALALLSVWFFFQHAWEAYVSDSELWAITLARHLHEEWTQPWMFTRPAFYLWLGVPVLLQKDSISIFHAAKAAMLVNSCLIGFFSFRLVRRLVQPNLAIARILPWAAVLVLFTFPGFFTQGYRIRSDMLLCTFVLWALERTLAKIPRLKWQHASYWILPFLVTPKAIVFAAPGLLFARQRKWVGFGILGLAAMVAAIFFIYPNLLIYVINAVFSSKFHREFLPREQFVYLFGLVSGSLLFFAAFLIRFFTLGLRIFLKRYSSLDLEERHSAFALYLAVALGLLMLMPEKVPFYLAAYLPLVICFTIFLAEDLWVFATATMHRFEIGSWVEKLLLATALVQAAQLLVTSRNIEALVIEGNRKAHEMILIDSLERFLARIPKATYYDVVGLVPARATLRFFTDLNNPEANEVAMRVLQEKTPDLIVVTNKVRLLEPEISHFLAGKYVSIHPAGIYALAHRLAKPLPLNGAGVVEIGKKLQEGRMALGASSTEQGGWLLLSGPAKKKNRWVPLTNSGLSDFARRNAGAMVLAYSPMPFLEEAVPDIAEAIRFDWEI